MSFGITQVQKEDSVSSMFARADKAMYTAKQEGRNRVHIE
jgi:PleD family two-component response regulator